MPKKIAPTFFFIGNHPVLDFINTLIAVEKKPVDLFSSFTDVLDWLRKAGYLTEEEALIYGQRWGSNGEGTRALEEAKQLRSHLLNMLLQCKRGEEVAELYMESINKLLKEQVVTTKLVKRNGGFAREQHSKIQESPDMLMPVAEAAVQFFSNYDMALVKKCENPDCVLHFYDNSKNSTRRWCSQKTCGNRMKVAAYLERQQIKSR